jgi:Kef-type K+ transport system membrane component KefB
MSNTLQIFFAIPLILFLSPFFSKILKLPTIVIEIILGMTFGFYGLISQQNEILHIMSEAGFLYLMFLAGMEVDFKKITKISPSDLQLSISYMVILYLMTIFFVVYFEFNKIFIATLPLISIGLIATLAKEYGKDAPWIKISMIVGTIGEIISIVIFTLVSGALKYGTGFEFYKTIIILIISFVGIYYLFRILTILFWWFPSIKQMLMPHIDNQEKDIRLVAFLLLIIIGLMYLLKLELALGAFVSGVLIASFFNHKKQLFDKLESFGFGFMVPIFFIYVGSSFKVEAIFYPGIFEKTVAIMFAMIASRLIASIIFMNKLNPREVLMYGFSHSMPLTLLIALATIAYQSKTIDTVNYYSFILAGIGEVIISLTFIKILNLINKQRALKKNRD